MSAVFRRSQSVAINDKHIEVICRQMLRSVRVTRVGDTDFLVDEQVDRFRFMEENEKGGEKDRVTPSFLHRRSGQRRCDSNRSPAEHSDSRCRTWRALGIGGDAAQT